MKGNYKFFLCTLIALIISGKNISQVAVYSFSQFAGTYSAITGGTVFGNAATDDQVFVNAAQPLGAGIGATGTGMPIGFSFLFNNIVMDRVAINANGFLMFGPNIPFPQIETQCSDAFNPISATSTVLPVHQSKICAFGHDIQGQAGSEIRMETIGTTPNQTLVVQWTNYRKYNHTGDNFNFQIRVCETTNVIEMIYGPCTNNAVAAACQVGLRGLSQNDYKNRFVNALNLWPASAPGNANNSVCNFNQSLLPTNGLVYRWTPPPLCAGNPPQNAALANPPTICPGGTSTLSLANSYSLSGLNYSWQSSTTSSLGPYIPIANGNLPVISQGSINSNTWFNCVVTCPYGGGGLITTAPFQVQTNAAIVDNIPYFEGFENIIFNNQVPNCSWTASNPTVVCQTYVAANTLNRFARTGNKFAAFRNLTNPQGDFFYTNGLQLYSGVTYSATLWYLTDNTGSLGWSNLSILVGSNQNAAGLTTVASATGIIIAPAYKPLTNTFTVPTSGVYYLVIKCTGSALGNYLCWDDLEVTIPCQLNTPSVTISASSFSLCSGNSVSLTANGANTYTWSNGALTQSITATPSVSITYSVTGSNTITSCDSKTSAVITVSQPPAISAFAQNIPLCMGKSTYVYGFGAPSYTWSNGATSNAILVNPTVSTIYTLQGSSADNCVSQTTVPVIVQPLPMLTVTAMPPSLCVGENLMLNCSGAQNYSWTSSNLFLMSNPIHVIPKASAGYTVFAKDIYGCEASAVANVTVNLCTGLIPEKTSENFAEIFPNPVNSYITVNVSAAPYKILMYDITGKLINERDGGIPGSEVINTETLNKGVYFLRVKSSRREQNFKIIKE